MQNTLFGLSPTALALMMVALTTGVGCIIIGMAVSNPLLAWMGLRNMVRRPTQSVMMIAGLTLSSVFITASFGLQDSFSASAVARHLAQVGSVDESVSGTFSQSQVNAALARLRQVSVAQAATGIFMGQAQVKSDIGAHTITEYGVSSNFDQVYGLLTDSHGQRVRFADLHPNEVFLSQTAGQDLDLQAGDPLQIQIGSGFVTETVRAVLTKDLAVTTGEVSNDLSFSEILLPLGTLQQHYAQQFHHQLVPNIICVKNLGSGGLDDGGPSGSRSQAVLQVLQHLFGVSPIDPYTSHATHFPTDFDTILIHPLKPTVVEDTAGPPIISNKGELIGSPAARQFSILLPVFTCLLVGAGMLLLVLQVLLLASERRAELGMSRAIGLQQQDLVQSLLIEGAGYGVVAALLGVPLGVGTIALELLVLSHLPGVGLQAAGAQSSQASLSLSLTWQSALLAWCLAVLITVLVVVISAIWMSRMNIVAAIRDVDEPLSQQISFYALLRELWTHPLDAVGQMIPETSARRRMRRTEALGRLIWELLWRGPLFLLLGGVLLVWFRALNQGWIEQLGTFLLIAGGGLLVSGLLSLLRVPTALARRLSLSGIGIGWLLSGLHFGMPIFIAAFAPSASAINGSLSQSLFASILSTFLPLIGVVLLVMSNVDLLAHLLARLIRLVHGLAPISRMSLVFPLTFRLRTGVTIALLSLITFMVVLIVTNNLSAVQQAQVRFTTGNFQLELDVDAQTNRSLEQHLLATPSMLHQDVAAIVQMMPLYNVQQGQYMPISLLLPGHPHYPAPGPTIASDAFLSLTTMPMFARAQGFASDQTVWNAVRDHPGYAVLPYAGGVGLPTRDGFTPFTAAILTGNSQHTTARNVTIIGIVPNNTYWTTLFLSHKTATSIGLPASTMPLAYCFRLQPGVNADQASHVLGQTFHLGEHDLSLTVLGTADQNAYTQTLTLFLAGYLALGLLFGAFSIGVITSRAVVERRQQIGMLRAIGFSRNLVQGSFLLEASFVITLSLLMGSALAWWLVSQVTSQFSQTLPTPIEAILLLLLGSYLVVLICTLIPARRAARIPPAEALRYE